MDEVPKKTRKTSEAQRRAVAKYQKKRMETDPDYKEKKNNASKLANKLRYQNDPEFRESKKAASKLHNERLRNFYNQFKDIVIEC